MNRFTVTLVSLLCLFLASASPAAAITNGQPDGWGHPYVGMVYNDLYLCSGVLISPTVFLTAGHCTIEFQSHGSQVYVTFQPEASFDGTNAYTGTAYTHPDFCIGCAPGLVGFDTFDIGVVVLDVEATGYGYGELAGDGLVNDLANQSWLTAVGYGVQDFARGGGPPQPVGIATRYYADVVFLNDDNRLGDMFIKHSGNPSQGKGGTCFGDSGGPIFAADQVTVLALTSFGTNSFCAGLGYAQRVDHPLVLAWLDENFV